jgi:hypothetical protein
MWYLFLQHGYTYRTEVEVNIRRVEFDNFVKENVLLGA